MVSSRFRTALALSVTLAFFLAVNFDTSARGGGRSSAYSPRFAASGNSPQSTASNSRSATKCASCPRDRQGQVKRDPNAVSEFKRTHPKPPGCHQCEVDHIVTLSKGGRDDPNNTQWLPKAQHQDKTRRDLRP